MAYLMAAASFEETEKKETRSTNHHTLSRRRANSGATYISYIQQRLSKLLSVLCLYDAMTLYS